MENGKLNFKNGDEVQFKSLQVGGGFEKLASTRMATYSLAALLYPTETALPANSFIQEIHVDYPHRELSLWGWKIHWLVVFLVVSIISGYSLKGVFKVQI